MFMQLFFPHESGLANITLVRFDSGMNDFVFPVRERKKVFSICAEIRRRDKFYKERGW